MRERHLFLLTDGAVGNTSQVIDLIKTNSENNKVHTFGIGSGASTELVKEKVLDCLQRESYEYMSISSMTFYN